MKNTIRTEPNRERRVVIKRQADLVAWADEEEGLSGTQGAVQRGWADDLMTEERSFVPLMKFGAYSDDVMRDHTNSRVRMRWRKFVGSRCACADDLKVAEFRFNDGIT